MKHFKAFLIALISSLGITGISFIDGKIWNVLFYIIGIISYLVVGMLISFGLLASKKARSDAYVIVFVALSLSCLWVYNLLAKFRAWLLDLPVFVKIIVPCALVLATIALIIANCVLKSKKKKINAVTISNK